MLTTIGRTRLDDGARCEVLLDEQTNTCYAILHVEREQRFIPIQYQRSGALTTFACDADGTLNTHGAYVHAFDKLDAARAFLEDYARSHSAANN